MYQFRTFLEGNNSRNCGIVYQQLQRNILNAFIRKIFVKRENKSRWTYVTQVTVAPPAK